MTDRNPFDTIREALNNTIQSVPGFTGPDVWWKPQVEVALAALDELREQLRQAELRAAVQWARTMELEREKALEARAGRIERENYRRVLRDTIRRAENGYAASTEALDLAAAEESR